MRREAQGIPVPRVRGLRLTAHHPHKLAPCGLLLAAFWRDARRRANPGPRLRTPINRIGAV